MTDFLILILRIYLWFCLVMLILYIPRLSYFLQAFKKQPRLFNPKKNQFAVIIPARQESKVIKVCLDSLFNQTYERSLYDVYVVIDSTSDPTAEIASNYPNTFVVTIINQTSKGEALDGVMKSILADKKKSYNAFIIIDADNLAENDFLEEMNNALVSEKQIICGKKLIKNWLSECPSSQSFVANCTALTYVQVDDLGNKARTKKNIPINMVGTGMLISAEIINELNGWPYRTLTEDFEMTTDSIVKGWSSMYYEHAKVYTEEATKFKTAFKRKLRWIKGYVQCDRRYRKKIVNATFKEGKVKWKNFDYLYGTFPAYGFFIASGLLTVFGIISCVIRTIKTDFAWELALKTMFCPLLLIYLALFFFTLITILADYRNLKIPFWKKLILLFFNPLYLFSYFRVFIMAFFTNDSYLKWENTERVPFQRKKNN